MRNWKNNYKDSNNNSDKTIKQQEERISEMTKQYKDQLKFKTQEQNQCKKLRDELNKKQKLLEQTSKELETFKSIEKRIIKLKQFLKNDKQNLIQKCDELTIQIKKLELNNAQLKTILREEEQNSSSLTKEIDQINETYSKLILQLKQERNQLQDEALKENLKQLKLERKYKIALRVNYEITSLLKNQQVAIYKKSELKQSDNSEKDENYKLKLEILNLIQYIYQNQKLETEQNKNSQQLEEQIIEFDEIDMKVTQLTQDNELLQYNIILKDREIEQINENNQQNISQSCKLEENIELENQISLLKKKIANLEFNNLQNSQKIEDLNQKIAWLEKDNLKLLSKLKELDQNSVKHNKLFDQQKQITNSDSILAQLIDLKNQLDLQMINVGQFHEMIQNILSPPLPIAIVLGQKGVGKTKFVNKLFQKYKIKEFTPIGHYELNCYFVDTLSFEFKSSIDKREEQIKLFQSFFKKYPNKVADIFIFVNFQRIDMMKNKIQEVHRYFKKFIDKITIVVTNFHLSQNGVEDTSHLKEKFKIFKAKEILFIDDNTDENDIIQAIKKIQCQQNEDQFYPFGLQYTFFKDENQEEIPKNQNGLNGQSRR